VLKLKLAALLHPDWGAGERGSQYNKQIHARKIASDLSQKYSKSANKQPNSQKALCAAGFIFYRSYARDSKIEIL